MAYIGKQPTVGNFQVCDAISVVNGQAAYTMQVNSTNVEPETANHMLVSLNGVLQKPGSSFTISGSTITFASNLATGDVIDFIILLGDVLNIGAPSDDTVTAAKLNNDIISGQTELAATPADTDELLISDAGTIKRIDFSHLKTGITEADAFRISADQNGDSSPITGNIERVDDGTFSKIGTGMSVSSGIFTFPSTGIYYITGTFIFYVGTSNDAQARVFFKVSYDGSNYNTVARCVHGEFGDGVYGSSSQHYVLDVNDTSNVKVYFQTESFSSDSKLMADSTVGETNVTFIRLGDT